MVDQPPFRREAVAAPVYISWGAVIAGAIAASALTFVLITFGAAIGLAIASPSATWRDTSVALSLLSGLWLLLTAVASFALGGYLAGRLRAARPGLKVLFVADTPGDAAPCLTKPYTPADLLAAVRRTLDE